MTTLDNKAVEKMIADNMVGGTEGFPVLNVAAFLGDLIDALSSFPEQGVEVKRWRDVGYLMACIDDAIEQGYDPDVDGPLLDEIRAELKAPPSQPAAAAVTDEMVTDASRALGNVLMLVSEDRAKEAHLWMEDAINVLHRLQALVDRVKP